MPEEVAAIAITAIIAAAITVLTLAKMVMGTIRAKNRPREQDGSSLTTSELTMLVRDAVEDATQPLYKRIQSLEQKLDRSRPALEEAARPTPLQLEIAEEEQAGLTSNR